MAVLTVKGLASEVATILGESLALDCHPQESPFPDIEDKVRTLAPVILEKLIIESRWEDLSGFSAIESMPVKDSNGVVTLPLPGDYLRLVSVKMTDWNCPVISVADVTGLKAYLQKCSCDYLRGSSERPLALLDIDASGGRCLKLYSSSAMASLDFAWYMARPAVTTSDTLNVPDRLKSGLVTLLAQKISSTE